MITYLGSIEKLWVIRVDDDPRVTNQVISIQTKHRFATIPHTPCPIQVMHIKFQFRNIWSFTKIFWSELSIVWTWFEHLYYNRIAKSRCFRQGQIIFCVVDYWWGWSRISHAFSFVENTSLKQVHHLILHITKWSSLDQPLKFSSHMPKQSRHSLASQFEQTKGESPAHHSYSEEDDKVIILQF